MRKTNNRLMDVWTHRLWGAEAQLQCMLQMIPEVGLDFGQQCV